MEKICLKFHKTFPWFKQKLLDGYSLSVFAAENIDFSKGFFQSAFRQKIELEYLYDFKFAARFEDKFQPSSKSTDEIFIELLHSQLSKKKNSMCIFEDAAHYAGDRVETALIPYIAESGKERYFVIPSSECFEEILDQAAKTSDGLWHFLVINTQAEVKGKPLSKELFKEICDLANVIILGAYDGDGYVVWEKAEP